LLFFLVVLCWHFLFGTPAWAIVIETEKKQRVAGYLVSEDPQKIVIHTKTAEGKEKVNVFDPTKIKVIHKIDLPRLEKLSQEKPAAYIDYGRELAQVKADPEAMDLALRLYLIAAFLDPPNLAERALVSMSELAAQPGDAHKYLAMAYLLDSKGDPKLLQSITTKPARPAVPEVKVAAKALARFQKALERYRSGDGTNAKADANEKGVAEFFARAGLDQRNFLQACDDLACTKCKKTGTVTCSACNGKGRINDPMNPFGGLIVCTTCNGKGKQKCPSCDGTGSNPVPDDYLRAVLRAEVWAVDQIITMPPIAKKSPGSWNRALNDHQTKVPVLTLDAITGYNPRECVFRNGKWTAP
jgi:hypothetical protein